MAWGSSPVAGVKQLGVGTSSAIDTTGADTIFIVTNEVFVPPFAPTDSKGNTWNLIALYASTDVNTTANCAIYYAKNATVGSGHTFSITGSFPSIFVMAFAGGDLTSPLDQQTGNGTNSASSPINTGTITPSADNYLVVSGTGSLNSSYVTTSSPAFTDFLTNNWSPGVYIGGGIAYYIQPVATGVSVDWTDDNNSAPRAAAIASFKFAAAASGGGFLVNGGLLSTGRGLVFN